VLIKDDAGKETYAFEAHASTVFTLRSGIIYIAEYHVGSTGCAVAAYDLKDGKKLWNSRLESRYSRPYSAYHNAVTIENNGEAIMVRGNEGLFRYVEYLDIKTGKTLAKREYPIERGPNPARP
jgi:outer membrane protein assembly factor BamB